MMTEKLYYSDAETGEFEAEILEIEQDKKGWRVVPDKTFFYPEGGGQPADKGWINGIEVTDVQKDKNSDKIFHYLKENPGTGTVKAKIDMKWRHDFMQQHTGQHIISGALWQVGKYKTVSVHMGLDYTTIEIEAPDIPENHLLEVEKQVNRIINENLPVQGVWTNHEELDKFPLRKPATVKGNIRLVRVGDFDCVGCGGLHLDETRKVELVKAIGVEKIRGNVRTAWKIGQRAFDDYRQKDKIIYELKTVLGTHVENYVNKTKELQEELIETKRKTNWLENRLADTMADHLYERREGNIVTGSWQSEDSNLIKKIMKSLLKRENIVVCLLNIFPDRLLWSIGCSEGMDFPFNEVKGELLSIIDGKGGGRPPLWQGTGSKPDAADAFLERLKSII